VRLSYSDLDNNGSINPSTEILSEKNYYPFGLLQKGYNNVVSSNVNSVAEKFKYNGKELQEELGLNTYDYGARMYDPAIGRFMQLDPHADSYPWATPYNYAFNNPALVIDPDGKDGIVSGSGTKDDPYVVTANYYYYGLNDKQAKGLQSAADAYNNGGKSHKIKDGDGNNTYVQFKIGVTEAGSAEQAQELATNDYKDTADGGAASFGNVVTVGSSSEGNELGSASRHKIELNQNKITNTLNANPGGKESSVIRGVFIHEIGHNIGGNHGDTGSIMQNTGINPNRSSNTIGGSGNGTFSYDNPFVDKNGIRAIMGRVNMVPGSINSAYLSDKENKRVNKAEKDGTVGRLKTTN
jgi:RHS repeat-associated protein